MASPSAAWRPWPTCSGPVGLAETNSTSTRSPLRGPWKPKRSPAQHLAHDLLLGRGLQADVDEAGAGDVDVGNPALVNRRGQQRGAQLSASWRGLSLSGLASCMAAVQAKSPWAATLGDSKAALAPAPGESCSSAAASAASNSCLTESIGGFYGRRQRMNIRVGWIDSAPITTSSASLAWSQGLPQYQALPFMPKYHARQAGQQHGQRRQPVDQVQPAQAAHHGFVHPFGAAQRRLAGQEHDQRENGQQVG
jgi:hypothetical protein